MFTLLYVKTKSQKKNSKAGLWYQYSGGDYHQYLCVSSHFNVNVKVIYAESNSTMST